MVKKKANPAFTRRDREICWICEERSANTQEHAFKSSRIKALWEEGGREPLYIPGGDGRVYKGTGPSAGIFMFGKTLCGYCNNQWSQPFDMAYDHFIGFILSDLDYFKDKREFEWDAIFEGTPFDQRDLARYYLKNFGCRMVDAGMEVPEDIRAYLLADTWDCPNPFRLLLYKNYEEIAGLDPNKPQEWLRPFATWKANVLDSGQWNHFLSVVQDGFIGAYFQWIDPQERDADQFCFADLPTAFIRDRSEMPWQELWEGDIGANTLQTLSRESEQLVVEFEQVLEEWNRFQIEKALGVGDPVEMVSKEVLLHGKLQSLDARRQKIQGEQQRVADKIGYASGSFERKGDWRSA